MINWDAYEFEDAHYYFGEWKMESSLKAGFKIYIKDNIQAVTKEIRIITTGLTNNIALQYLVTDEMFYDGEACKILLDEFYHCLLEHPSYPLIKNEWEYFHAQVLSGGIEFEKMPSSQIPSKEFYETFPCLQIRVDCPDCCFIERVLKNIIIHLNDDHQWSREQIADWIERLAAEGKINQKAVVKIGENE